MKLSELRTLARRLAVGDGTLTTYSDAETLVDANIYYRKAVAIVFEEQGDWQSRGDNKQSISITSATRSYSLASTLIRINRVEVKYPSTVSEYRLAKQVDYKNIGRGLDDYVTSRPEFNLMEDQIEIFVSVKTANIEAVTNGIYIYHETDITALSGADDEPAIPELFVQFIAYGMVKLYLLQADHVDDRKISVIQSMLDEEEANIRKFVAARSEAKRFAIRPKRSDYGQASLKGQGGDPVMRNVTIN